MTSRVPERCRPEASPITSTAPPLLRHREGRRVRSVVLINCPQTDDLVPTGVTADVLDNLPEVNVLNGCQACGGDHEWRRDEAIVTVISES
jgi:hypothetical protein